LVDVKDLELRQLNKNADKVIRAGLKEWQALQELLLTQIQASIYSQLSW
jgi:hypothetical protein